MTSGSTEDSQSVAEAARRSLERVIGERWRCAGRAGNIVWLGFGPSRTVIDSRGEAREISEYALHVQCPFRVLDGDQLVTGSSDIYEPGPGWDGDGEFDWDVQGANWFDVRARKLDAYLAEDLVVVTSVDVTAWGDLTISLSDDFRIEVRRAGSAHREHWRFFQPYRDVDHVVFD